MRKSLIKVLSTREFTLSYSLAGGIEDTSQLAGVSRKVEYSLAGGIEDTSQLGIRAWIAAGQSSRGN